MSLNWKVRSNSLGMHPSILGSIAVWSSRNSNVSMAPTLPLSTYVMISWGGQKEGRRRREGGEKEGRGGEKEGKGRGEGGEKLNSVRDAEDVRREIVQYHRRVSNARRQCGEQQGCEQGHWSPLATDGPRPRRPPRVSRRLVFWQLVTPDDELDTTTMELNIMVK